jgi:cell division transport system ATP-binding protein
MKMLLAEDRPSEGKVFFESTDIHTLRRQQIIDLRRRMGVIFQDFRLLSHKTVYENIAFAMEAAGRTDEEIANDVPYVLELVDLEDKASRFPGQLSGGEKQRLAIARAIVNQPEVIVADEPTGNLDPHASQEVMQILQKINELGTTVLLTTHDIDTVKKLNKRIIHLERGRVINDDAN